MKIFSAKKGALVPKFAKSERIDVLRIKGFKRVSSMKDWSREVFYIVASVEVGNTTTKCILTATNLNEGKTYLVNKKVRMTRDVRDPKPGEEVFGQTLDGTPLTRESVTELVRDTLIDAHKEVGLDIKTDLNFVVRSTGVVANFDSPDDVGVFILALADGCIAAGVPTRNMTPAMSKDMLPEDIRKFSMLDKVYFDGAVGSVLPPFGSTGVEIVANEMEGELATVGIKEGAKWAGVEYRNPCASLDFGTTLDGRITNDDIPYAKTIGNFCGLAGAIPDNLIKGAYNKMEISALDVIKDDSTQDKRIGSFIKKKNSLQKVAKPYIEDINDIIRIEKVPTNVKKYGLIPVNAEAAKKNGIVLIGCDVGDNGNKLNELRNIGKKIVEETDNKMDILYYVIDEVCSTVAERLLRVAIDEELITTKTAIGFTGRSIITGFKPFLILEKINRLSLYKNPADNVVFVDDGLARGAAMMARCMNSLGNPKNPIGGVRGGKCILKERIKYQKRDRDGGIYGENNNN